MPTDPPSANPTNASVPPGQAIPNPQLLPQQQPHPRAIPQQPQHLRFPQHPQQLLPQQSAIPLPHPNQPQHIPRQQYAALSQGRNISQMQQPHLSQPPHPLQPPQPPQQQPRQHPRPNLNHQQQPPPQQQYFVNGAYPALNAYPPQVAAQYGLNPNYVFPPQGPYYNGMQPQGAPQQPGPQNPRAQRPYPRNVPSQPPQRQPQSRVTVPAPRKHILAIVDPDTNEEVKFDNPETKSTSRPAPAPTQPTSVKIPARTSRPLELVSDPADSESKTETSAKVSQASASVQSGTAEASTEAQKASTDASQNKKSVAVNQTPVSAKSAKKPVPVAGESVTRTAVQQVKPTSVPGTATTAVRTARGVTTSDGTTDPSQTAPKRFEDVLSRVPDAGPDAKVETEKVPVATQSATSDTAAARTLKTSSDVSSGAEKVSDSLPVPESVTASAPKEEVEESKVSSASGVGVNGNFTPAPSSTDGASTSTTIRGSMLPEAPAMGQKEVSSSTVTSVDTESSSQVTARRERPVFKEGDRRVYPPDFMLSMRSSPDPKMVAQYEASLSNNNIIKGGPSPGNAREGDPRGSRSMKATPGPLSADPRGKKAFPAQAASGYMGARGGPPAMVGGGVGSYDAFDLRSARSQNPPPAPKGQPNHGRGNQDPRGSRGRFDGPTRGGHGPIDPFVGPPVEKLKRSDTGWKRDKEADDVVTTKVKTIRSLLNKLTLEKFDKIFKQIIDINISSYEILTGVVKEVFEKALFEPKFSGMYAELCVRLDISTKDMLQKANVVDSRGKLIFFKNILLNNCRDEFTRFAVASEAPENKPEDTTDAEAGTEAPAADQDKDASKEEQKPLSADEKAAKKKLEKVQAEKRATKAKQRMLANVRFIGELFLKDLLRESIIHKQCIQRLLTIGIEKREEDVLEALCKLLSKTGAKLSQNKEANTHMERYFNALQKMSRDHSLPARVRFMLQDLLEQRHNGWKVRREEAGAKTISEIHKDIEKEDRAKAEAQAALRERRGRGGGGMQHRDRGPHSLQPRVAMTMASRQKTGSGMSRSSAMLEKIGNRSLPNAPSNIQVRLGPGGKSSSVSSSLRPGGSRYGSFSALSEPRESGSTAQSGDVRRTTGKKFQSTARRSVPVKPEPVEEKPKFMDPEKLRRKTRGIVEEFWSIAMMSEAKECIEQEIQSLNYPKFVEEAIKFSLATKVENREKSIPLFIGLIEETIPVTIFIASISAVIAQLSDIEMDDPRASEFLAKYVAAIAASGKLKSEQDLFCLDFLQGPLVKISDPKRATKFVAHICAELYAGLNKSLPDEKDRKEAVKRALNALDLDLSAMMSSWNPMRGIQALESMLKDLGILFILPLLPVELRLKETLDGQPTAEGVVAALGSAEVPEEDLRGEAFMKMVIRVSFDWLFMNPPASVKDVFGNIVGNPLVQCFKGEIPRDVQMAALLETQSFIVRNLDILPSHTEGECDKPGSIAFDSLYFADIVEEETFLGWKEDTDKSTKVDGKDKMIMQTSPFFRWLETAEEE